MFWRGRQGQRSSLYKAKCVALRARPASAPSTCSFIDSVLFTHVQFVVWKAPMQFPKEFARTDGIVIAQRRHRQQQLCKWLQVMTVKCCLANLFEAPLAINVRARHSQENTQRRRLQAQEIVLHTRTKRRVASLSLRLQQSLGKDACLLCVAQRGRGLLFDQS